MTVSVTVTCDTRPRHFSWSMAFTLMQSSSVLGGGSAGGGRRRSSSSGGVGGGGGRLGGSGSNRRNGSTRSSGGSGGGSCSDVHECIFLHIPLPLGPAPRIPALHLPGACDPS